MTWVDTSHCTWCWRQSVDVTSTVSKNLPGLKFCFIPGKSGTTCTICRSNSMKLSVPWPYHDMTQIKSIQIIALSFKRQRAELWKAWKHQFMTLIYSECVWGRGEGDAFAQWVHKSHTARTQWTDRANSLSSYVLMVAKFRLVTIRHLWSNVHLYYSFNR